jgi:hypothetical protein
VDVLPESTIVSERSQWDQRDSTLNSQQSTDRCEEFLDLDPKYCLHKGRPSYKRSLQSSKENIKFITFKIFSWVIFALLDPDPDPLT